MAKDTTPIEEFRRVTATTMRAVSRKEVNVSFVPAGGSLLGSEARITVPARDLPVEDVSRVRGEADSMALKLRHHDRKTHLRRVPRGEAARAIFEAVEQVRVAALAPAAWPASPTTSPRSTASAPTSAAMPASSPRTTRRSPT